MVKTRMWSGTKKVAATGVLAGRFFCHCEKGRVSVEYLEAVN
jgi:hypothetical protein